MPIPNLSVNGEAQLNNFTAANITWKKEGTKVRNYKIQISNLKFYENIMFYYYTCIYFTSYYKIQMVPLMA